MFRTLLKRQGAEAAIEEAKQWTPVYEGGDETKPLPSTQDGPTFEIEACNCTDKLCVIKSEDALSTPANFTKLQPTFPAWVLAIVADPLSLTEDEFNNLTTHENW